MTDQQNSKSDAEQSRRQFLASSAAVAGGVAAANMGVVRSAYAAGSDLLKVGLVGCGGRGTGAASQALAADKNVKLVAMGDVFADQIERSLTGLQRSAEIKDKIAVDSDHKFVGWDAYKHVVDSVDVVLLATSPHFRPLHVEYGVQQGKHLFVEKPVGTDAPHVRRMAKACQEGKKKGLGILSGLCYRYQKAKRLTVQQIHDGLIGDVRAMQCFYDTGYLWHKQVDKPVNSMEYQMRNWLYFTWLSGDHIIEQHIHSYDKCIWVNKDVYPISAMGVGGRIRRVEPEFGNVYDHFHLVYNFENGLNLHSQCRQQEGCATNVSDQIIGTKGTCDLQRHFIRDLDGKLVWRAPRLRDDNMYQNEHDEFFASIRKGEPLYNGDYMVKTTMMGIMGRMAAYTGQLVTWEQAWNSTEDLMPATGYQWGTVEVPPVPKPGVTKVV